MKVRLAFAVAAHLEPDILIVDEVLAVGDAEFQKKAIGKMQDISGENGRTVLFVSHNMAAVKNLCTRGVVLEDGKSVFSGNTGAAVDYYLNNKKMNLKTSLSNRKDRTGSGEIKFSKIEFLNKEDNSISEILSGSYCKFRLSINFESSINKEDLIFGLVIFDNYELKLPIFILMKWG